MLKKVKYPSLDSIVRLQPNPRIILGEEIFWQEKRDGSNLGVYLNEKDEITIRSRNMPVAEKSLREAFMRTDEFEKVKDLVSDCKNLWNDKVIVFGEMLLKGKSPTKTEFHEKEEFIMFDIYSAKVGGLLPYILVHQHAYHYDVPIVELYGSSVHKSMDSLYEFRDEMLELAEKNGREGVVGKTFKNNVKYIYFKEKLDTPKLEKKPRKIDNGEIVLPPLPESEILGALNKTMVDLGPDAFRDKAKAMPLFAKYVRAECEKHLCSFKGNLFSYYKNLLEELE